MNIRDAIPSDLSQILDIYNSAIINTVATFDTEKKDESYFREYLNNKNSYYLCVAVDDNKVVGYAGLYPFSQRKAYSGIRELTCYIHSQFNNRGIATKLITFVEDYIYNNHIHTVLSLFNKSNKPMQKIMDNFGFKYHGKMDEVAFKFNEFQSLNIFQKNYPFIPGNTAFQKIKYKLGNNKFFNKFIDGEIDRKEYFKKISKQKEELVNDFFNEDMLNLSARLIIDDESFVDKILENLICNKVIRTLLYNKDLYNEVNKSINRYFQHRDKTTYIFPEESRFIFALANIYKPKRVVYMGSYYSYWAIWSMFALPEGSELWLMDIDKNCQELAKTNILSFDLDKRFEIHYISEDAIEAVKKVDNIDFLVLDAEGPKGGVSDPDLIDKAIYYPMIKAAYPCLKSGSIVLAHNILLSNNTDSNYIDSKISWNTKMFAKFLPYMQDNFKYFGSFESTEGIGVSIK